MWPKATIAIALLVLDVSQRGSVVNPSETRVAVEPQTTSSVNYASSLLRQANLWGGIEDYRTDCSPDVEMRLPPLTGTLKDALTQLEAQDTSLKWGVEEDGIFVRKNLPATSLLDTKIAQFTFDKNDSPDKATDALLSVPTVRSQIRTLNMSVRSPEPGFAQPKATSENRVTLTNVTFRQALNAIARATHPRVWLFRQTACGGQKTLLVQWVVK